MRRDDELRVLLDELVHAPHQRELAVHRKRRLGLVEEVEAARAEPVDRDVEERLAVRLLVQRPLEDVLPSPSASTAVARLKTLSARRKNDVERRDLRPLELEAPVERRSATTRVAKLNW